MPADSSAVRLAELRARAWVRPSAGRPQVEQAAALVGRMVVDAGERWLLAFEEPVDPRGLGLHVRELSTLPLVVLAICVGLCWPDRAGPIYPGEPVQLLAVFDALAKIGAGTAAHHQHILSAIDNDLVGAGLLERVPAGVIRLGPALAAWPAAEVEVLRRAGDLLPEPAGV